MKTITTKRGDTGTTSLGDGTRVDKDNLRIELNGELDELVACIGLCRAACGQAEPYANVQRQLMGLMAFVAKPHQPLSKADEAHIADAIALMECEIDRCCQSAEPFGFVFPGSDLTDAALHMARAKARTCERRMVALAKTEPVPTAMLTYLNRLSDYLFTLAIGRIG